MHLRARCTQHTQVLVFCIRGTYPADREVLFCGEDDVSLLVCHTAVGSFDYLTLRKVHNILAFRLAEGGPVIAVVFHLELSSPRMKEDLLVMSKLAAENSKVAHFVSLTTASKGGGLSNRDRKVSFS